MYIQGLFEESSTQKQKLGTVRILEDGRKFVYCSNTAASLAAGVCLSKAAAPVDATIAAADALLCLTGAKEISLTIAGATAGLYKDGILAVKAGADIGCMYKVAGNKITNDPATGRAAFSLYDSIETTWVAANSTIAAWANAYASLLVNPAVSGVTATTQELVMGITTRAIAASKYFWAQTWGLCNLQLDIDAAAGGEANEMWVTHGSTEGRGRVIETAGPAGMQILGNIFESADQTDAEASLVNLCIS
jgi:hypothetical protein